MQARQTLTPSQKGTKKFLERYGKQLICVRYRYDDQRRKRFTTVDPAGSGTRGGEVARARPVGAAAGPGRETVEGA